MTHDCQFQRYYRSLTVRRGAKRAIVAVAHKMLRVLYAVLTTGTPYRDPQTGSIPRSSPMSLVRPAA